MLDINKILHTEEKTKPKNFFIFAGAGAGKTYTLVQLLRKIKEKWGDSYLRDQRHIAVITYTNAATDEIMRRVGYDNLFYISTIHSFVWNVIKPYQNDIKLCYSNLKIVEIEELKCKQATAKRTNSKAYIERGDKIIKLESKLANIDKIVNFNYNPNGDNFDRASLNHEDVIKIGAKLLNSSLMLQKIVSQLYPFILVDESQDTKKEIVDALLELSVNTDLTLGFIGDIKQRIYADGKENMLEVIPEEWNKPVLSENYRSGKRIVELGNKIGSIIDDKATQLPIHQENGFAHLFVVNNSNNLSTEEIEQSIALKMVEITDDPKWAEMNNVKQLVLEHMMAARRMHFDVFFSGLNKVPKYSQSFLKGNVSDLSLFSNLVLPLVYAISNDDNATEMNLIRKFSPLMKISHGEDAYLQMNKCAKATHQLQSLIARNGTIREVVKCIADTNLFPVNDVLEQAYREYSKDINEGTDEALAGWIRVMDLPFSQVEAYLNYVSDKSRFATHQGVKGLEYDRVMVIIDDNEAKGFLFSYDKVFEVKPLSDTDHENKSLGKETSLERTLRLLYVICTRAVKSLALVTLSNNL